VTRSRILGAIGPFWANGGWDESLEARVFLCGYIYIFIHQNMIERTEQKVQQKSTHKKEKKQQ